MNKWQNYLDNVYYSPETQLMIDYGGMGFSKIYMDSMSGKISAAIDGMAELEGGSIANPTERRMVGHYWLRAPELSPKKSIMQEIEACNEAVKQFVHDVHSGVVKTEKGGIFKNAIVSGIGGSSLGTLFISNVFASENDKMKLYFMDNTDPDGIDDILNKVKDELDETLVIVISKSGGTIETRNCMEEARAFYEANGLSFAKHAVCVTGENSLLHVKVVKEKWIQVFPMWDFIGGRTSVMSAVGLLPLMLQGIDTDEFLRGAAECDVLGRNKEVSQNPAAIMALSWYLASGGKGGESVAVLPYKSSLELFAKYLQQLTMESLGKEYDLDGNIVHQGLAVYGYKGSSDQHSYVQQLVAGPDNVFVTFIQILKNRKSGGSVTVGERSTSGDYLDAFMYGTKKALEEHGKKTLVITLPDVSPYSIGQLIALFERTVGLYALLINVNAYDQPAVEHGKKAAAALIDLKNDILEYLMKHGGYHSVSDISAALGKTGEEPDVFRWLLHLEANDERVKAKRKGSLSDFEFGMEE